MRIPLADLYNTPDERNLLDTMKQGVIGKPLDRPEGPLKVSGTATYSAEYKLDAIEKTEETLEEFLKAAPAQLLVKFKNTNSLTSAFPQS